ncbi:MAG: ATP-dependent DNA helicase [Bacteroidaceae bacterium]|nr:ATP-dependent DNA helicase [Bacteroidaceae bacterium]
MFEFTYSDNDILESYKDCGKAYKKGVYDFTFENRYLIYHAPLRNKVDYIALDLKTGLASSVITKNPGDLYTKASYRKLIPHIFYSVKYTGDKRYLDTFIDKPYEIIDAIFRVVLPNSGYNIREEQIALAKKMYMGFTEKQVALCEAEVGTGKTLSYLVAAIVAKHHNNKVYAQNMPITITTSNIELQKALVEREIPNLSRMLLDYYIIEKPLTAVLRKGKEHYLCRFRLEDYLRNIKEYPSKYAKTIEILEDIAGHEYAIDLDKMKISGMLKSRICIKGTCVGCRMRKECAYQEYCDRMYNMPDLDFQVTNHNMYLMSQKTRREDRPPLLRSSAFVVVDEAHKFKEAAEDTFGECLNEKDVDCYLRAVKHLCPKTVHREKYQFYLNDAKGSNSSVFASLRRAYNPNDIDDDKGSLIKLTNFQSSRLFRLMRSIEIIEEMRVKNNCGMAVTGKMIIGAIDALINGSKNTIWIEKDENDVLSVRSTPKNIDTILYNTVWNKNTSHVLTSGTMSDGTDFEYFKEENGLDQIPRRLLLESRTASPFDYENHTRLYLPKGMPLPDNDSDDYFKAIADKAYEIIQATHGHTAILFTSYKALRLVYELLKDKLTDYDVLCMTRSNKTAISDFKKSKNGILFASGSMWEGVDCVGDCLSSVIIVKLPFPMRSAIMEEKKENCNDVGEFVDKHCTPNMLIKLRQGVGRLIRCETDTGLVSILDPRATSKAYCRKVSAALEKYPLIENTDEITAFFKQVKNGKYFD